MKYFLILTMLVLSTTAFAGYTFDFTTDYSQSGPTVVEVEDSLTGNTIAEWTQLAGEIGSHLNISMFSDEAAQLPDIFELVFTCSENARFDTSGLIFNYPYDGYYQFQAPNILVIGGSYNSVTIPTPPPTRLFRPSGCPRTGNTGPAHPRRPDRTQTKRP